MPGASVGEGAKVTRALVADGIRIGKGAKVGSANSQEILLVDQDVKGVE
jgi:glucose-1-phosphate adenylyltransferase